MKHISPLALKRLNTLYSLAARHHDLGSGREDRLAWAERILGRKVASFTKLNVADAKTLIDTLQLSLGQAETAPARRGYSTMRDRQKQGTEGRHDQIHAESTLLDGDENVFDLIRHEMTVLGWNQDRLHRFLTSNSSPLKGRTDPHARRRQRGALGPEAHGETPHGGRCCMKRNLIPEGQISIFPAEVMTELFRHPQPPPAPKLDLPFPQTASIDQERAARILDASRRTVRRLCERELLKHYRIGGRNVGSLRIEYWSLVTYCDELRMKAGVRPRAALAKNTRPKDRDILPFPTDETVTVDFVTDKLDCGRQLVLDMIEEGKLTAYRLIDEPNASWRIWVRSLERYIESLHRQARQKL